MPCRAVPGARAGEPVAHCPGDRSRYKRAKDAARLATVRIAERGRGGRWAAALAELAALAESRSRPNLICFNAAIAACGQGGEWQAALQVLAGMLEEEVLPDTISWNSAISACERGGQWARALALLRGLPGRSVRADVQSYNAAAAACARAGEWEQAAALLAELPLRGLQPDQVTTGSAIAACSQGMQWERALVLLARADRPSLISCNAAISACGRGEQWEQALCLLRQTGQHSLVPDLVTFNAAIGACQRSAQWELAVLLLAEMWERKEVPNVVTYGSVISSFEERGERWDLVLHLLSDMRSRGLAPNVVNCNAAISACAAAGQWEHALCLFAGMPQCALHPNLVSHNAAASACAAGGQWRAACALLRAARRRMLEPDAVGCNAAISAFEKGAHWAGALDFLCVFPGSPDAISWTTAAAAATAAGEWARALGLLGTAACCRVALAVGGYAEVLRVCEQRGELSGGVAALRQLAAVQDGRRRGCGGELATAAANAAAAVLVVRGRPAKGAALLLEEAALGRENGATRHLWEACARAARSSTGAVPGLASAWSPPAAAAQAVGGGPLRAAGAPYQKYAKELQVLRHVLQGARPGDADSVSSCIEAFGDRVLRPTSLWLKVAGGPKADVLLAALRGAPPPAGRCPGVLEVGAYCGYSSTKVAAALPGVTVTTLEMDPVHAVVARNVVALAGLVHRVHVWIGHSKDLLASLPAYYPRCGALGFGAAFMDQKGSRYHEDLATMERSGLLRRGAAVVADNVLKPGAPLFLWYLATLATYRTQVIRVPEFAMPSDDWMSVCIRPAEEPSPSVALALASGRPPPPPGLLRLHWDSDRIRGRTVDRGSGVDFTEWAAFANDMRERLAAYGVLETAHATAD